MKRCLAVLTIGIALLAPSATVFAQAVNVGVKAGYASPNGTFGDLFDGAMSGGLYGEYVYSPFLSFQGSWLWHKHDATEELTNLRNFVASETLGIEALTDTRLTMNELDVNAKLSYPMNPVTPYLLAGLGLYYWKLDGKEIVGEFDRKRDETFWDWGINFGGGATFPVTEQWSVGAEVIYTHVFDELDDSFINWLLSASYGFSLGF